MTKIHRWHAQALATALGYACVNANCDFNRSGETDMFNNKHTILASLAMSALALACTSNPVLREATDDKATSTLAEIQELTNFTWTVQYCQDPGDEACDSYRELEPGDQFQVKTPAGSKDAELILVKHSNLDRYEFQAAIVTLNDNLLVLNFDDQVGKENSCKQLTVNLIKENGQSRNPDKTCAQQLQDAGLKMSAKQIATNCAHNDVRNWSIASTGATPPNCLTTTSDFVGFHAMSPPDPGEGSGTGRN
jgi:hypothetical protein